MGATRREWSPEEDQVMTTHYPDLPAKRVAEMLGRSVQSVYTRANLLGLKKSEEFNNSAASGRTGHDDRGATGRFRKGSAPWNKGLHYTAGGRSAQTQFKKGERPHTWVPIGTETLHKGGYLKRKVRDDAPKGQTRLNWEFVHVLLWEEHNGPVPDGHVVIFKNGNNEDIRIENLELVSRGKLMKKNTIHRYPTEVKQAIRTVGKLKRIIREKSDENTMDDLRNHLFETIEGLKDEENPMDLERAKVICNVSQQLVETAKVEVKFLEVTGIPEGSQFLENKKPQLPGYQGAKQ